MEKDFNKIKPHKSAKHESGEFGIVIKQVSEPVRQLLEILDKNKGAFLVVTGANNIFAKTRLTSTRGWLHLPNGQSLSVSRLHIDLIVEYCERVEALGEGKYKYQLHPEALPFIKRMEQTI